ncbi:AAA family ATPase [Candidatus Pacearchaeota archaeon]|nr:AAA family ATPase [Candidatus Pacearchaeota archaeon]
MHTKIIKIINETNTNFYERDMIIKACWAALLSRQHVLLIGMPGTGKSMIINELCSRIEKAEYFKRLLTRFSTPEELFGPISVKGLENDDYRRIIDNMLPEAHISFIDEIFKGNAAILNSLLTLINERRFDNGKTSIQTPLVSMFGASNELPEEEELEALYDRFILRFDVKYIQDGSKWEALMTNAVSKNGNGNSNTTITLEELDKAQKEVAKVKFPEKVIKVMRDIKMTLEREGLIASDRRWTQTVRVLQAWAWLQDRDEVIEQDLELLCDMLWKEPAERTTLVSKILSVTNPLDLEAIKYYDDCKDVFSKFQPSNSSSIQETAAKLRKALEHIDSTLKFADVTKTKKMKEVRKNIGDWYKTTVESMDL